MIQIEKLIMEAMKAKDKVASETYKLIKAKILEFKTAKNAKPYDEAAEVTLLQKMIKERNESAKVYSENNRQDLADAELAQVKVIESLLPTAPSEEDIIEYIKTNYPEGIEQKKMGLVIKEIKSKFIGADGSKVSQLVKERIKI